MVMDATETSVNLRKVDGKEIDVPLVPGPAIANLTFQFERSRAATLDLAFLPSVHRRRALVQNAGDWLAIDLTSGDVFWKIAPLRGTGVTPLALSDDGKRRVCSVATDSATTKVEWIDDDLLFIDGASVYSLSRKKTVWELNTKGGGSVVAEVWMMLVKLVIADVPHQRLVTRSLADIAKINEMRNSRRGFFI